MFNLSYLSHEDKRLLGKLRERLSRSNDPKIRNDTEVDINTVIDRAKPYTECTIEEANELRLQLIENMNTLSRLGKPGSVESFANHLKDVDFYIQTLQLKMAMEPRKVAPEYPPNSKDQPESLNSFRKNKEKVIFGNTRWLVDMDEEDDEE